MSFYGNPSYQNSAFRAKTSDRPGAAKNAADDFVSPDKTAAFRRVERLARWLDSAYRIPFTNIRIGGDALMDLAPGVGLLVSQGLSAYIVYEAYKQGAPLAMLGRMVGRLGLDTLISATPGIGMIGDIFYRANLKNVADLRTHMQGNATFSSIRPDNFAETARTHFQDAMKTAPANLKPIKPIWVKTYAA